METIRLIYISEITEEGNNSDAMRDILKVCRKKNARLNITGVLLFDGIYFLQILEGTELVVSNLYRNIAIDKRHRNASLLQKCPISHRWFEEWSMGYYEVGKDAADNRGVSPGMTSEDVKRLLNRELAKSGYPELH